MNPSHSFAGTDLLILALKDFPPGNTIRLKEDFEDILCELSGKPEYAEFFINYPFDRNGASDHSRAISEAISTLYSIRGYRANSVEKTVEITGCIQVIYERCLVPKMSTEQKELCKKFSEDVQQYLA